MAFVETTSPGGTASSDGLAVLASERRRSVFWVLTANPLCVAGLAILSASLLLAVFAGLLAPGDPLAPVGRPLQWPGQHRDFPLGTDSMGRDMLAGLLYGARVSLLVGFSATVIGTGVGVLVGALSGYFGGWIDSLLTRLTEIFQTIPNFILLVVMISIIGPSVATIIVAIGLVSWTTIARLVRAEFRSIKAREYVIAAKAVGVRDTWIILRHILPNALSPIILTASIMVASAILSESALSFMGLGDPNAVSWGSMIGEGRQYLRSAWYVSALPGLCIVLTVLSLNLIGDGLSEALDPRLSHD